MGLMCAVAAPTLSAVAAGSTHVRSVMTFDQTLALAGTPALQPPTDFTFVLGQHSADLDHLDYLDDPDRYDALCGMDNPAFFRPATEGHLVLTGEFSTGKSVLVRDLARQTVDTMDVYLFDSWHALHWPPANTPAPVAGLAGFSYDLSTGAAMLRTVRDEVERRRMLTGSGEPADRPRILVLLDDSRHLILDEYIEGYEGNRDREAAQRASDECLAILAEIADDPNVTIVFASLWSPEEAAVPADLLESGFTHLALDRPRWPETRGYDPASGPRYAGITRPGSDTRGLIIDHRDPAIRDVALSPSCI